MKLFTVHGDSALASWMPISPKLVEMVALICAGSVDTLPDRGGLTGLVTGSGADGYWQLAPRSAGGANAGNGGTVGAAEAGDPGFDPGLLGTLARVGVPDAVLVAGPWLWVTRVMTKATTAASARTDPPTIARTRRLLFDVVACGGCGGRGTGCGAAGAWGGGGLGAAALVGLASAALAASASSIADW